MFSRIDSRGNCKYITTSADPLAELELIFIRERDAARFAELHVSHFVHRPRREVCADAPTLLLLVHLVLEKLARVVELLEEVLERYFPFRIVYLIRLHDHVLWHVSRHYLLNRASQLFELWKRDINL